MIFGIGIDLIEMERIEKAIKRTHFLQRIYTEAEQHMIAERASKAAGNFAVKEAVVKAFGTGFGIIQPKEIEVFESLEDFENKSPKCIIDENEME